MKFGILTFHNVPNYGAALQAFALKSYLESLSEANEVSVIDYQCCGNQGFEPKDISRGSNIFKTYIKRILMSSIGRPYIVKCKKFSDFRHQYLKICPFEVAKNEKYDCLFFGSDQIWNPRITNGLNIHYFHPDELSSKVYASYAASCGEVALIQNESTFFDLLSKLDFCGVREKSLLNYINSNNCNAFLNIDPTFLLNADQYLRMLDIKKKNKKYIFVYELMKDDRLDQYAQTVSSEKKIEIIKISGYQNWKSFGRNVEYGSGPLDFIEYIAGADYVITNSFHGVAFSLIFQKQFFAVIPPVRGSRITDLLNELNIENRLQKTIDYELVNVKIEKLIKQSKKYIEEVIMYGK